jgi:hypothetical protein
LGKIQEKIQGIIHAALFGITLFRNSSLILIK